MSLNDKLYNNVELKESISALIDNELITDNELELLLSDSNSLDCYVSYSRIQNSLKTYELLSNILILCKNSCKLVKPSL